MTMLLRLAYLTVTTTFAMFRLLLANDRDKDVEILAQRHQITVLQRQLDDDKIRLTPADRALLAALLHRLPRHTLRRLRLHVHPDTVLPARWPIAACHLPSQPMGAIPIPWPGPA